MTGGGSARRRIGAGPSCTTSPRHYVGVDEAGRIADPTCARAHPATRWSQQAFQLTAAARAWPRRAANGGPSATTSIMKNSATNIAQTAPS